jgi:hypothetical protein
MPRAAQASSQGQPSEHSAESGHSIVRRDAAAVQVGVRAVSRLTVRELTARKSCPQLESGSRNSLGISELPANIEGREACPSCK